MNPERAYAEGQTIDFTGVAYISAGINYSFDWGKIRAGAGGPEVSIGYLRDESHLFSISTGALIYGKSRGWRGYIKANTGAMTMGGALGLSLSSIDSHIRLGAEGDLWIGLLAYGVVSYRLIPGCSGFGTGFKVKVPYPIR